MDISDSDDESISERYIKTNDDLTSLGWADIPLRGYQLAGVNWLIDCFKKEHGSILGDEMGLGKTCQTIAFILYNQRSKKKNQPSLVVCPRSVLENWDAEIKRFAPTLKVLCYIGDKDKRNTMAHDFKNKSHSINVLVTTYELCLKDSGFLSSVPWACLIVDEAHRLKNNESQLHQTLKEWDISHSILLTGTPVQNNLQELYALLSFIAPKKFRRSGQDKFVEKFSDVKQTNGMKELHSLLKPYLLRRTKEEVLKDLPKKSEIVMFHGISKIQKKLYKAILTKDISAFETINYRGETSGPSLMNILMQLRKCVNHPYLFDGVEPEPFMIGDHLVEASGKLVVLDKMLSYLKSTGHKVLLFSQMTHMLDILQDYLGYREYSYERLDGSVRGEERFIAVQNFNKNEDTFVFLLSTKAGGQGLNLVAADTVIFIDSDFNPQNDLQAAARAHRIGQKRPVRIVRLVGRNTVEEIILKRAEDKLKLTAKVIEEGEFSLGLSKQKLFTDDKVKLQDILKFGVDDLLKDDDSSDTDIDFTKLLGPTVSGEWQEVEDTTKEEEEAERSDEEMEVQGPQSMYMFEGTDYSKEPSSADQNAFDELIEAARESLEESLGDRSLRRKTSVLLGPLGEVQRKPRKKLTPEEIEERKKKRKEEAEKRAKLAEEQEIRRAKEKRNKLEELWKANGYTSARVEVPSDDEEEQADMEDIDFDQEDDENKPKSRAIHYVSGDVMKPMDTGSGVNLIVHCADDSGAWGKGGLFTAISKRSEVPEKQYELAGNLMDLALGDCHLIPLDEDPDKVDHEDWLALIIAQHRDKRNNLSGIKLPALREGLQCVHYAAKARSASVHLPRIGHDTPGFNWYGTERLIKKHLASKGISTYIYYYPRKHGLLKRKTSDIDTNTSATTKKTKHSNQSSTSTSQITTGLLDLFTDLCIYIHPDKFTADQLKTYRRYFIAYDGDVDSVISNSTKIILIHPDVYLKDLKLGEDDLSKKKIVTNKWLDQCLIKRTCLPTEKYEMKSS